MRRDRAADAGAEAGEGEGERLVARDLDAMRTRGDLVLAQRPQRAADVRAGEPRLQQREGDERGEAIQ